MSKVEADNRIWSEVTVRITVRRRFNLNHSRAQIGQQRRGIGPGDKGGAFDDGDMVKNFNRHEILSALMFCAAECAPSRISIVSSDSSRITAARLKSRPAENSP